VTVWNLTDHEGIYRGQAATYRQWENVWLFRHIVLAYFAATLAKRRIIFVM
jgi:hypothetical protein